jgi:hypothetical protein
MFSIFDFHDNNVLGSPNNVIFLITNFFIVGTSTFFFALFYSYTTNLILKTFLPVFISTFFLSQIDFIFLLWLLNPCLAFNPIFIFLY